jgi:hypothetical protein
MAIKRTVGLTLGLGRSLMHGVAAQMCGRVASPLLGRGAGGRSPGYLMPPSVGGPGTMLLSTYQRARGAWLQKNRDPNAESSPPANEATSSPPLNQGHHNSFVFPLALALRDRSRWRDEDRVTVLRGVAVVRGVRVSDPAPTWTGPPSRA